MVRNITLVFIVCCVFLSFSEAVSADNSLKTCFKSPFSIFGGKKEKKVVSEDEKEKSKEEKNLNAQIEKVEQKQKDIKVFNPQNILGVTYIKNVVEKAEFYIEEEDFESAKEAIDSINEWVYEATEYHTDLFKTLQKLPNSEAQSDIERDLAIKFAVLRDKTLFLESKVLMANGDKKQAVENLVEVVRSQPSTDLGFKAYEMLQDIGFTYKIEYEMID